MENRINTKNWKEFSYEDFFEPVSNAIKLSNKDLSDNGNIPVYSSATTNNGCFGYTEKAPDYIVDKKRPMYLIFGDHTKSMFIIKESFSIMDNVKVFIPKIFNEYCIRFITTVWQKNIPNIGYARHWTIAKNTPIVLPIDFKGNPDWCYMEKYMKNIEGRVRKSLKGLNNCNEKNTKIDITEWREFKIGNIFEIASPKVYHTREVKENSNGIPYVVRSKFNNGIKYMVEKDERFVVNPKGVISFGAENASFFYQENEYISGRDMYYIDTRNLSRNTVLFIIACLEKLTSKYSYNFGLFPKLLKEEKIKLPVKNNGEPDYEYMDKYMSELLNKTRNKLSCLNTI